MDYRTICDTVVEKRLNKLICDIERQFKDYYQIFEKEIARQKEVAENVWVLLHRYFYLVKGQPCLKRYPPKISLKVEGEILADINTDMKKIYESNDRLEELLRNVYPLLETFDEEAKKVDISVASAFIQGDCKRKPICYYIEMISDIYTTFRNVNSKLKCCSNLLNENDIEALENYQKLLKPDKDFLEYFKSSLCYMSILKENIK